MVDAGTMGSLNVQGNEDCAATRMLVVMALSCLTPPQVAGPPRRMRFRFCGSRRSAEHYAFFKYQLDLAWGRMKTGCEHGKRFARKAIC